MTTVGYVRISDSKGSNVSLERQWHQIVAYCARMGLPDPRLVEDVDKSGSQGVRPAWEALLKGIKAGTVTALVSYSRDRLFRDEEQASRFLKLMLKTGCALHLADHGVVDLNTADGVTMFQFGAVMDAHYSRKIRERSRNASAFKRMRGERTGAVPYGHDEVDGLLVVNEFEQSVIVLIRAAQAGGMATRQIARVLSNAGIPSKTGLIYWSHSAVAKILSRA